MAETVKKSRIVSDDDLEGTLMEEFNMRLKSCLSQDPLETFNEPPTIEDNTYENIETVRNSTDLYSMKALSETFIETERREQMSPVNGGDDRSVSNGCTAQENIYENIQSFRKESTEYVDMEMNGSAVPKSEEIYEDVQSEESTVKTKPSFSLLEAISIDCPDKIEAKSAKDRMLLSSDDTSTLLFTQTVTSPMLTPSEENVDFLRGFRRESTPNSSPKNISQSEESPNSNRQDDGNGLIPDGDSEVIDETIDELPEEIYENLKRPENEIISSKHDNSTELNRSVENSSCHDDSEAGSEELPQFASQIEQRKTSELGEEDELTEMSDVCSLDKQVSDSDSSNMILYNDGVGCKKKIDEFGVIQSFIENEKMPFYQNEDELKLGYDNSEVLEYIAMTEQPRNSTYIDEQLQQHRVEDLDEEYVKPSDFRDYLNQEEFCGTREETQSPNCARFVDEMVENYGSTNTEGSLRNREKDTETVPPKIVQNLTSQFMKNGDDKNTSPVKSRPHDVNQLKSVDIMKQINKFEHKDDEKSSFSKFDALQKKNVLHIRSSDSTKAQEKFNGSTTDTTLCKCCGKQVFQMEQIKAEKAIWHKNCFRCNECKKQLNVDTYESHEGRLYCKPHFKALFAPRVVDDSEEPPSDKPDLGLEELQSLNVKERFQVFEQHLSSDHAMERTQVNVKRSPSILSKLAKFQSKGMDVGVADDSLNGIPIEESSSEEEEEEEIPEGEDPDLVRAKRVQKEKPFHFTGMSDVKSKWEHGEPNSKDERREERKQEIQSIRNKLFMGKQGKMKEAYQEAVMKSESSINLKKEEIQVCDTKTIKERFEKGEVVHETVKDERSEDDQEIFESEISKKSRSLFLQLDAHASKPPQMSPMTPPKFEVKKAREAYVQKSASQDTVKSSEQVDDVTVQTADIQQRFKFFETYREPEKQRKQFRITPPREGQVKGATPEREVYHDPDIVRAEENIEDSVIAKETHTATKMLSKFRQMEENMSKEPAPQGPKPLKRFTPPPEPAREDESSSEEGSESEEEVDQVDQTKIPDEDLVEAQKAARAKQLRAKFEKWEVQEMKREQNNSSINILDEYGEDQSQIESTKLLRARFESMRENHSEVNKQPRVKVNRFV